MLEAGRPEEEGEAGDTAAPRVYKAGVELEPGLEPRCPEVIPDGPTPCCSFQWLEWPHTSTERGDRPSAWFRDQLFPRMWDFSVLRAGQAWAN